jgi:predicted nucleic acid-binding protein
LIESGFLLDTNVLSEARRKRQDPNVAGFVASLAGRRVCVSAMTIGELRKGAAAKRAEDRRHADMLDGWIDEVEAHYAERILPIDLEVATVWGKLSADRPRPIVDTLLAATAIVHGLTVVTRDIDGFADTGVVLVNPWTAKLR